jgi:hypothetical protein
LLLKYSQSQLVVGEDDLPGVVPQKLKDVEVENWTVDAGKKQFGWKR